jgi:tetratricopeptide (TPR) repeat protein
MKPARVVVLTLALAWPATAGAVDPLPDLLKGIRPAVVTVAVYDSTGEPAGIGSGFFIDRNRVVTNHHVMRSAYRAEMKTAAGATHPILGVVAANEASDLILLDVEPLPDIVPLQLEPELPAVGERIIVVGSPLGLEQTVSDGIVSSLRAEPGADTLIQITAPFSPGSSGSPVVNAAGLVVGVATRQLTRGQNLNFAVPARSILALSHEDRVTLPQWSARFRPSAPVLQPDPTLAAMAEEGEALEAAGQFKAALAHYMKMAERYPEHPDVLANIGSSQAHLGEWESAIFVFERVLEMRPDDVNVLFNMGTATGMLGRWEQALDSYQKVLELTPGDVETLSGIAWALIGLGRLQEAMETCREAIRLDSRAATPHRHLAQAHLNLGQFDESLAEARKAVELDPTDPHPWQTIGVVLSNRGQHEEAVGAYKEALRLAPTFAEVHSNLGLSYAHLERWPEAVAEYKAAIRLRPELVEVHFNLGVGYFRLGDRDSAMDEYKIIQKFGRKDLADRLIQIIYE